MEKLRKDDLHGCRSGDLLHSRRRDHGDDSGRRRIENELRNLVDLAIRTGQDDASEKGSGLTVVVLDIDAAGPDGKGVETIGAVVSGDECLNGSFGIGDLNNGLCLRYSGHGLGIATIVRHRLIHDSDGRHRGRICGSLG